MLELVVLGRNNVRNLKESGENIVALCDVDWNYEQQTFEEHKGAKRFRDFRKMLDEVGNVIAAVVVSTPDHAHAIVASHVIKANKHVYIQNPLAYLVYESRYLTGLAETTGAVTQMGNQGNSGEVIQKFCEWIWDGAIGEVKEVHCWTNRPIWPQGMERSKGSMKVPGPLDRDLFLRPAPERPYHGIYTPWNWRAWWGFGTGILGDMGYHIIYPAYKALKLKYIYTVETGSTPVNTESAPMTEIVTYCLPQRDHLPKVAMPPEKLIWYDGEYMPHRPKEVPNGEMMGNWGSGILLKGSKRKIIIHHKTIKNEKNNSVNMVIIIYNGFI